MCLSNHKNKPFEPKHRISSRCFRQLSTSKDSSAFFNGITLLFNMIMLLWKLCYINAGSAWRYPGNCFIFSSSTTFADVRNISCCLDSKSDRPDNVKLAAGLQNDHQSVIRCDKKKPINLNTTPQNETAIFNHHRKICFKPFRMADAKLRLNFLFFSV